MVGYKEVEASNALLNDSTAPRVSVFVGGTSGIGLFTIRELVGTGASVRVYIVGRKSSAERMKTFIDELKATNSKADIVWVEGEISLLADTTRICKEIQARETRIDLLFLTAGYAPFGSRRETAEGYEVAQALEYYSRTLFTLKLMPQLQAAEAPRVVNVLAGGIEGKHSINLDDLDLKKPGNFSGIWAQRQYTSMLTMSLDHLATEHPNVTFVHSWPMFVNTGNGRRGADPNSWLGYLFRVLEILLVSISLGDKESGQRHLFVSTSAMFGGRGIPWKGKMGVNSREQESNGLFLVNYKCNCTPNANNVSYLRETTQEKVWAHTEEVLGPYLQ